MLFWIYILITAIITILMVYELFEEKNWKQQIAYAMSLIPLLLRIFGIK